MVVATEGLGPLTVLYVNTVAHLGGAERCMLRIMKGLDSSRWIPLLACPQTGPLADAARSAGFTTLPLYAPQVLDPYVAYDLLPEGLGIRRTARVRRPLTVAFNMTRVVPAAILLAGMIRRHGVGIVHANSPRAAMVGGLAARLTRRPVVTHVRDIVHSPFRNRLTRRILGMMTDRFIVASEATARIIPRPLPTHVVYDGLPADVLASRPRRQPFNPVSPHVGMVAFMSPWKGHEQFIRAAHQVVQRYPDARFTVVGGDWGWRPLVAYRESLERLIGDLGMERRVTLTGLARDVAKLLAELDLFVHPPTAPDPFPGVVLEACAAGCPIIASRIGGIPEILADRESALLVQPGDHAALAKAIVTLLDDPAQADRLGAHARLRAQQFTLERTVAAIEAIYAQIRSGQ